MTSLCIILIARRSISVDRYTERVAEAGGVSSLESRGASSDDALAESVIGIYKTELVRNKGPWHGLDDANLERSNGSAGGTMVVCWSRSD